MMHCQKYAQVSVFANVCCLLKVLKVCNVEVMSPFWAERVRVKSKKEVIQFIVSFPLI